MELVRELFLTASLALVLSFLVAKLVAMALAGDSSDHESELKSTSISDERVVAAEKPYEDSLRVQGSHSETRVEFVKEEALQEVDHFQGRTVHQVEEIAQQVQKHRQEEFSEEVLEEGLGKESETVGLPEKLSDGEDKASVEKACDFDLRGVNEGRTDDSAEETLGNKGMDIIGVDLVTDDVVVARPEEEVNAVSDESKGKDDSAEETFENREVGVMGLESATDDAVIAQPEKVSAVGDDSKSDEAGIHDESDEDDWEGIEKSELENEFAAAVKFVEYGAKNDDRLLNVGSDVQMELYGLHKVATEGPCYESQPMALKLTARAKWNAWQRLGNMNPEKAMEQYINILSNNVPGWIEGHLAGEDKRECSKEETTITHVSDTCLHTQPNFGNKRVPELKSGADGGNITGGSNLESRVVE